MKLLIDVGNTRVKWVTVVDRAFQHAVRQCAHDACATAWAGLHPTRVIVCSVAADAITDGVLAALPTRAPVARFRARVAQAGVISPYAEPASLGDDRWANLIAAHNLHPGRDVVVADAGTAVTIDLLRADGQYVGGAILAGYSALRSGLVAAAPILPASGGRARLPATNTADAVAAGAWYGLAGAIERIARELGGADAGCLRVLTGGDAASLQPLLSPDWQHDPLLTMYGLLAAEEGECAGSPSCS